LINILLDKEYLHFEFLRLPSSIFSAETIDLLQKQIFFKYIEFLQKHRICKVSNQSSNFTVLVHPTKSKGNSQKKSLNSGKSLFKTDFNSSFHF